MCLGIPMQVISLDGAAARCAVNGAERVVSLLLLLDAAIAPGDWVLVAGGNALERMEEGEARATLDLMERVLAAETDRA